MEEDQQALLEALLLENREAQLSLQRELGLPTEPISSSLPHLPGPSTPSRGVEAASAEVGLHRGVWTPSFASSIFDCRCPALHGPSVVLIWNTKNFYCPKVCRRLLGQHVSSVHTRISIPGPY